MTRDRPNVGLHQCLVQLTTCALWLLLLIATSSCSRGELQRPSRVAGTLVSELDPRIWSIRETSTGELWFGSNGAGVFRFDGKTLRQFTETDGLGGSQIRDIQEDKNGGVLVSAVGGVARFDGEKFSAVEIVEPGVRETTWRLDPSDTWILVEPGEFGPCRFDGDRIHRLELPSSGVARMQDSRFPRFRADALYTHFTDSRGHLWFGTAGAGLCRYDGESFDWLYEERLTTTPSGGAFGIRSIYEDRHGEFWICNTRQRFEVSREGQLVDGERSLEVKKRPGLPHAEDDASPNFAYYSSVTEDRDGHLWFACGSDGVWEYDGTRVRKHKLEAGAYAITILHDSAGRLWVGTLEHGVFYLESDRFLRLSGVDLPRGGSG